jgi:hypothetical protein
MASIDNFPPALGRAVFAAAPLLLLVAGCATMANKNMENGLAAAGFIDRPANTPQRTAMLSKLPAHQFVRRVLGDKVKYVYADPSGCNCLYVGSQAAYGKYQRQNQRQGLADERQMAAMDYQDAAWNWGAWGPWNSGWGFGPGYGW